MSLYVALCLSLSLSLILCFSSLVVSLCLLTSHIFSLLTIGQSSSIYVSLSSVSLSSPCFSKGVCPQFSNLWEKCPTSPPPPQKKYRRQFEHFSRKSLKTRALSNLHNPRKMPFFTSWPRRIPQNRVFQWTVLRKGKVSRNIWRICFPRITRHTSKKKIFFLPGPTRNRNTVFMGISCHVRQNLGKGAVFPRFGAIRASKFTKITWKMHYVSAGFVAGRPQFWGNKAIFRILHQKGSHLGTFF